MKLNTAILTVSLGLFFLGFLVSPAPSTVNQQPDAVRIAFN
jgi:hypothetical protein